MRGLLEHRSESEELSLRGLIHDDFLVVLIDGSEPYRAGDHNVSLPAWVSHFVDALPRSESFYFDLAGQNGGFFVVE
jgi:hypothetical protein